MADTVTLYQLSLLVYEALGNIQLTHKLCVHVIIKNKTLRKYQPN
jgi:hypothetical protein